MKEVKPKPPLAGLLFGETIYWGVMLGSVLVVIGSVLSFLGDNYVPVSYWLSASWKGEHLAEIWKHAPGGPGGLPMGHWYLPHLTTGDGLCAFGISLGVFSVAPALLLAAFGLYKDGETLYGSLALVCAVIVMIGVLGLMPMPG